jgi:hypothetical protein
MVVDFGMSTKMDVLKNDLKTDEQIGLTNPTLLGIKKINTQLNGYKPEEHITVAGTKVDDDHGQFWYLANSTPNVGEVGYSTSSAQWNTCETFVYCVEDYDTDKPDQKYYYYGTVKVLPATTLYFEDDSALITYKALMYQKDANGKYITEKDANGKDVKKEYDNDDTQYKWNTITGTSNSIVNAGDLYGYSDAHANCTAYSMGGAKWVKVNTDHFATATFTFTGTGFDVISMTNGTTGNIGIKAFNSNNVRVVNKTVDTYYGYKYVNGEWIADGSESDSLYQVPVIKATGLPYDTYTVTITATYASFFDHNKKDEGYNFYLDAIRIYDPLNDGKKADGTYDQDIVGAYTAEGEGWPEYYELRNQIISTGDLDYSNGNQSINGVVFIDR